MPSNLYRSQYVNSLAHDDSLVASSNMIRIGPGNGLVPVRRQGFILNIRSIPRDKNDLWSQS